MGEEIVERFRRASSDAAWVVLEGFHAVKHALRFGATVEALVTRDAEALERMALDLAPDLASLFAGARIVPAEVYERLTPRPHPTGVAALASRPQIDLRAVLASAQPAPVVVLEDPRRPENLGAAIRVAAAAGAAGVLTLMGADPWHPAAVRGAAGLQFALPVARLHSLEELFPISGDAPAFAGRRPLIAVDPGGDTLRPEILAARALLAFGSERRGLSPSLLARAELRLAIPMRPGVSSLNLATAIAVVLYAGRWWSDIQRNL